MGVSFLLNKILRILYIIVKKIKMTHQQTIFITKKRINQGKYYKY